MQHTFYNSSPPVFELPPASMPWFLISSLTLSITPSFCSFYQFPNIYSLHIKRIYVDGERASNPFINPDIDLPRRYVYSQLRISASCQGLQTVTSKGVEIARNARNAWNCISNVGSNEMGILVWSSYVADIVPFYCRRFNAINERDVIVNILSLLILFCR